MHASSERLFLPSGTVLYAQGQAADAAYIIMRGRIELVAPRPSIDGHEIECRVGVRRVGEIVGELAIVDGCPREDSAIVLDDSEVLVVRRDQISRRVETCDPLLRLCFGVFLERYRETAAAVRGSATLPFSNANSPWAEHFIAARDHLSSQYELRRAIERGELELNFQPIVQLATRRLVGFEALLRWRHPERGLIFPNDFIPLAEGAGLIFEVTTACLTMVARQFPVLAAAARARSAASDPPLFVNVNISGLDLERESFAASTVSILCDGGVDPSDVHIEITESVLIKNLATSVPRLQQCRDHGMQIAIDDFGTGYSSLNYLNTLPVSIIKLDRSFARSLLADTTGRKIIAALLHLGGELNLTVVAEGIEQESEAALLTSMGCDLGQGFLFGRPTPLAGAIALTQAWEREPAREPIRSRRATA